MNAHNSATRILIFGTYDGIHDGHRHFFGQARSHATHPYLIASIARDANVLNIKGKLPYETEDERKEALSREILIDEVVLGTLDGDYIEHIVSLQPDIIALGYDQAGTRYTEHLEEKLHARGCKPQIIRCDSHRPDIFKSSKIRRP